MNDALGNQGGVASVMRELGSVALAEGDVAAARAWLEPSLSLARSLFNHLQLASTLDTLAEAEHAAGNDGRARALCTEGLAIRRELKDAEGIARSLQTLGELELTAGNRAVARACGQESLTICCQRGFRPLIPSCLELLARTGTADTPRRAAQLFGAAAALREELGAPLYPSRRPDYERYLATLRHQLGEAAFAAAWSAGRALTVEQALAEALRETPCRAPGRRG